MSITVTIPAPPQLTVTARTEPEIFRPTITVTDQAAGTVDRQFTIVVLRP